MDRTDRPMTPREMRCEIKRLQAIVDKLPKTADHMVVVPGMRLWYIPAGSGVRCTDPMELGDHESALVDYEVDVYSTRADAEAAGEET